MESIGIGALAKRAGVAQVKRSAQTKLADVNRRIAEQQRVRNDEDFP